MCHLTKLYFRKNYKINIMNIVITGASKGIGYALAKVFAVDSSN
jgi:short-subunit dehydrogenase